MVKTIDTLSTAIVAIKDEECAALTQITIAEQKSAYKYLASGNIIEKGISFSKRLEREYEHILLIERSDQHDPASEKTYMLLHAFLSCQDPNLLIIQAKEYQELINN